MYSSLMAPLAVIFRDFYGAALRLSSDGSILVSALPGKSPTLDQLSWLAEHAAHAKKRLRAEGDYDAHVDTPKIR